MKVYLGADHRGFPLKEKLKPWLASLGHEVIDCGNTKLDPDDDFPDFAVAVSEIISKQAVLATNSRSDLDCMGIIICGSGGGVSIAANKVKGIRCALGVTVKDVLHNRQHNDINILAIASDSTVVEDAKSMIEVFLSSKLLPDPRFGRRIAKIRAIEEKANGKK
jgi:ribose 5-phosphate isomerase B